MKPQRRQLVPAVLAAALGIPAAPLSACQICFPIPLNSAADRLIGADTVVLAREDPGKPFSLVPLEVLKGNPVDEAIDIFPDSTTRRQLKIDPRKFVICAYQKTGPDAGWERIGITNDSFAPLVREILERAQAWRDNPRTRSAFFAGYLGHDDPQVRSTAHIEVARAPYDQIRSLGTVLPHEELRRFLRNFRYIEWHALYILLLAQSGDPQDHAFIEEKVVSAERFGLSNQLAAWATAYIEIKEQAALEFLGEHYFANPDREPKEIAALLLALSVHGTNGHTHLRDRIVAEYRTVLDQYPEMAAKVVGDLLAWERYDLAGPVAALAASAPPSADPLSVSQIRYYVNQAGKAEQAAGAQGPSGTGTAWVVALSILVMLAVGAGVASRPSKRASRR